MHMVLLTYAALLGCCKNDSTISDSVKDRTASMARFTVQALGSQLYPSFL